MNSLSVKSSDGRDAFSPGETIEVDLRWELDTEPAALELRCVWTTAGKGSTDIGIEKTVRLNAPGIAGSRRIELGLPAAPYSFSGKLVSLIWGFELVAQPSDESCRRTFTLAPEGRGVLLHRSEDSLVRDDFLFGKDE